MLKKLKQNLSDEYKDGEKIYWLTIESWRDIYGEDTVEHNNRAAQSFFWLVTDQIRT
jgi:hypothetical protein